MALFRFGVGFFVFGVIYLVYLFISCFFALASQHLSCMLGPALGDGACLAAASARTAPLVHGLFSATINWAFGYSMHWYCMVGVDTCIWVLGSIFVGILVLLLLGSSLVLVTARGRVVTTRLGCSLSSGRVGFGQLQLWTHEFVSSSPRGRGFTGYG